MRCDNLNIMDEKKEKDEAQAERGAKGGAKTKELYGKTHYAKMAKKRWKKKQAMNECTCNSLERVAGEFCDKCFTELERETIPSLELLEEEEKIVRMNKWRSEREEHNWAQGVLDNLYVWVYTPLQQDFDIGVGNRLLKD